MLFGGIKVGQVTAVRPWSEDPTRIEIVFAVKSGTPLNQKSTARVGTVSLMTTPALMITTGSNEAGRLSAGDVVPSAESVSLEEIEGRVAKLAESADALIDRAPERDPGADRRRADAARESEPDQRCAEPEEESSKYWRTLNTLLDRESPKIAQITDQISELAKHADSVVGSVEPVVNHVDQAVVNVDNTVERHS